MWGPNLQGKVVGASHAESAPQTKKILATPMSVAASVSIRPPAANSRGLTGFIQR